MGSREEPCGLQFFRGIVMLVGPRPDTLCTYGGADESRRGRVMILMAT